MLPIIALYHLRQSDPIILPVEYGGSQVYRTSHALLVADDLEPTGLKAFGNSIDLLRATLIGTCGFPAENIVVLRSSDGTLNTGSLESRLLQLKDKKRVDKSDRVLLVFALHGTLRGKKGFFVIPSKEESLMSMESVINDVIDPEQGIPANHVLMLADTCHAGAFPQSFIQQGLDSEDTLARRLQRPCRSIWAASNYDSTTTTVGKGTRMISDLVSALSTSAAYENGPATDTNILQLISSDVPVPYAPVHPGYFVWSVKRISQAVENDATSGRQAQLVEDQQNQLSSYKRYQDVLQARIKLEGVNQAAQPIEWAQCQLNLATALMFLPTGNRYDQLIEAQEHARLALRVWTQAGDTVHSSNANDVLGNTYLGLGDGKSIESAIAEFEKALLGRDKDKYPLEWAEIENNLGTAYARRRNGPADKNLADAEKHFTKALSIYEKHPVKQRLATIQSNIGALYMNKAFAAPVLPEGDLLTAIKWFKLSLSGTFHQDEPYSWADTQRNLASVYRLLSRVYSEGDPRKTEYLKKSVEAVNNALHLRNDRDYPFEWAMLKLVLGSSYSEFPSRGSSYLKEAVKEYTAALTILTPTRFPFEWANAQSQLGLVFTDIGSREGIKYFDLARESYRLALTVYSAKGSPEQYAGTKLNQGLLYMVTKELEKARECFAEAIRVGTGVNANIVHVATEKLKELPPKSGQP